MSAENGHPPRRLGVISDIHSNLEALQAVLKALEHHRVDQIVCCGDVVGYGASPNECVELLRERNIPSVLGNHDAAVLDDAELAHFNHMARDAAIWTREVMTKENIEWLRAQPMRLNVTDETLLVHASPKKPEEWNYVLFYADATEAFQSFTERICFIGHSHQPFFIALMGDRLSHLQQREVRFGEGGRHLVNVGSVGQPRDRDWRAAYLVVDYKDRWMALEREPYDLKTAQEKILQVGAAPELAERLESGC